jgi:DNA polymerase IV
VTALLDPMPVNKLFGVGPKTAAALNEIGVTTLQELRLAVTDRLTPIMGRDAAALQRRAAGIDDRPVVSEFDEKQISTETTFDVDISNVDQMQKELLQLADRTAARLRNKQVAAHGIAVKIRRHDFSTFTRQRRCHPPTNESKVIANLARQLLDEWLIEHPGAAVRLLGVGSYDLGSVVQLSLFDMPVQEATQRATLDIAPQNKQLDTTLDRIRAKFGNDALVRGSSLQLNP